MVAVGWAVLDLPTIVFIKLELCCGRFAPLHNSKISFHKISVDLILRFPSLIAHPNVEPNLPSSVQNIL